MVQFGELKFVETSYITLYLSKLLLEMGVKKKLVPYLYSLLFIPSTANRDLKNLLWEGVTIQAPDPTLASLGFES